MNLYYNSELIKRVREIQVDLERPFRAVFEQIEQERIGIEHIKSYGWFLVPALLDLPNFEVVAMLKFNKVDFENKLIEFFNKNNFTVLNRVVKLWNKIEPFEKRKKIFLDALEAHKVKKYTLSIPALVPLIEGVIRDLHFLNNKKRKKISVKNSMNHIYNKKIVLSSHEKFIGEEAAFKEVLTSLFNNDEFRNTISHNLDDDYDKEILSLKLFCIFDKLFEIYKRLKVKMVNED